MAVTGNTINAPLPGRVISIKVQAGDDVKVGQEVAVLEAMKMETSIVAKEDGVVDKIYVKEGDKVNQGDLLVSFVQEN